MTLISAWQRVICVRHWGPGSCASAVPEQGDSSAFSGVCQGVRLQRAWWPVHGHVEQQPLHLTTQQSP